MLGWLPNFLTGAPAGIVFFSIFLFGAFISTTSLMFGHDGDTDHDMDHGDGDHGGEHHGPGIFSIRGISLLTTGFGGFGYITHVYTGKVLVSSVAGLASGFMFAFFGIWLVRIFYQQEGSSLLQESAIENAIGVVGTSIPKDGIGQVTFTLQGKLTTYNARSEGIVAIKSGRSAKVVRKIGSVVTVREVSER